ncbi:MAG: hypothetical protein CSA95_08230 [Bacteroidetes bacterium]|nr:MAG: hypothetical protein CSA95_08230 [Bacteroidota bacterium]
MAHQLYRLLALFLISLLLFASCIKETPIPSYVRVEKSLLESYEPVSGSSSHQIVDVWLYVDNQQIGVFETPVNIPILKEGPVSLRLKAGVMANGIADSRRVYEFYLPYEQEVNLVRDSVIVVTPVYAYRENTSFSWIEGFEDLRVNMERTKNSDTTLFITSNPEEVYEGNASGKVVLSAPDSVSYFEVVSDTTYRLPQDGSIVVLEFDYKTESVFTVGLTAFDQVWRRTPVLNLNPTDDWKKVYVYLTTAVTTHINAEYYKVFIGGVLDEEEEQSVILLDNIKLLY